jgi:hypothetical protein
VKKDLTEKDLPEIKFLYKDKGWPVSMVSKKFGVSDYKARKFLNQNGIELNKKTYQTIIFQSFLSDRPSSQQYSNQEFSRENKICQRLFKTIPDVRFWKFFDFSRYSDVADSLLYFTTEEWEAQFREEYEVFSTNINEASKLLEISFGKDYKNKLGKKYRKQLVAASQLYNLIPDLFFWENFKFDEKVFSLYYYLVDGIKEDILNSYKISKINLKKKESEKIGDEKIGEDFVSSKKTNNIADFLSKYENG